MAISLQRSAFLEALRKSDPSSTAIVNHHLDMEHLKHTPCRNAHFGPLHDGEAVEFDPTGEHGRIEEVFGRLFVPIIHIF